MNEILFVIPLIILVVLYMLYAPKIKGYIGESRVARQLGKLNDEEYKVFNDVLIKTGRGSSQVDHIVISIYGIFVIETKNYSGWIHGNEHSEYWTQSHYNVKTKFRNPIRQNWAHIYALKEALSDFEQVKYYPIIVFAGSAKLKKISSKIPVVYDHQLFQTIMNNRGIPNLSIGQVNTIADKLNKVKLQCKELKKAHSRHVQNVALERKQKEKSLVCPRCSGKLVVRDGQYGRFYGCSNYPKCKYKLSYGQNNFN
ncbi:nuclease-related domain-containing protein [Dendrosporobacter sp. 1207_IL3150]|uniref:nuclease-related domain-containing protein n=1 Tax=Dendrosporobacter sp. 1207_IL3150 TaxID=3084054 RepID=UPI002FDB067B